MSRPRWEMADVFRRFAEAFRQVHLLSRAQRRVIAAIESCRTARLGGHVDRCDTCPFTAISYNSCRNRHCPKCQGAARLSWLQEREKDLLPLEYFHVVFTLPAALADLALFNKKRLYEMLFHSASQTLLRIARDPKHLGARIGFLAVLHTWGQTLVHHPHLHCVVPGGGLSLDGTKWVSCRSGFLLPVRVLSSLFQGLYLAELKRAFQDGQLTFPGSLAPLANPLAFERLLSSLRSQDWVVYVKPPFGGPQHVLRYLGRYTHRVALSNDRILAVDEGSVSFRFKDYRHGNQQKVMTLEADEFIRRFLLHVLPGGLPRIRHFGFLANRSRKRSLALCRRLIPEAASPDRPSSSDTLGPLSALAPPPAVHLCPACHVGHLSRSELLSNPGFSLPACSLPPSARASPLAAVP